MKKIHEISKYTINLEIHQAIKEKKIFTLLERIAKQYYIDYNAKLLDQIFERYNSRLKLNETKYDAKFNTIKHFYLNARHSYYERIGDLNDTE